jgi:uncharacterized protein YfdQ (DUF2303 family)
MNDLTPASIAEMAVVAALAQAAADPHELNPDVVYSVLVPAGATQQMLDLDRYLPAPRRLTGTYTPYTFGSFVEYVARHRDKAHTTVWVDQVEHRMQAVLDDHAPGVPAWGEHRALLQLITTPEWQHWTRNDGRYLAQAEFAEHIQDGLLEIVEPDAATMLEIAQSIEGKTKADWKTARRLDNGEYSFTYQEEIQAQAGRSGTLEIPSRFLLAIAPFYGEAPLGVSARLRYRIREGNLTIGYRLDHPNDVLLRSLHTMVDALRDEHGFIVFMGRPR